MSRFVDHETGVLERRSHRRPQTVASSDQIDAFSAPVLATPTRLLRGLVRGNDSMESQRGAVDVLPKCAWIRERILQVIATEGPKTDAELESRSEFDGCGPSSVRKRRTELYQAGRLVKCGRRDKLSLWDLAP